MFGRPTKNWLNLIIEFSLSVVIYCAILDGNLRAAQAQNCALPRVLKLARTVSPFLETTQKGAFLTQFQSRNIRSVYTIPFSPTNFIAVTAAADIVTLTLENSLKSYLDDSRKLTVNFQAEFTCSDGKNKTVAFEIPFQDENTKIPRFPASHYASTISMPWPTYLPVDIELEIIDEDRDLENAQVCVTVFSGAGIEVVSSKVEVLLPLFSTELAEDYRYKVGIFLKDTGAVFGAQAVAGIGSPISRPSHMLFTLRAWNRQENLTCEMSLSNSALHNSSFADIDLTLDYGEETSASPPMTTISDIITTPPGGGSECYLVKFTSFYYKVVIKDLAAEAGEGQGLENVKPFEILAQSSSGNKVNYTLQGGSEFFEIDAKSGIVRFVQSIDLEHVRGMEDRMEVVEILAFDEFEANSKAGASLIVFFDVDLGGGAPSGGTTEHTTSSMTSEPEVDTTEWTSGTTTEVVTPESTEGSTTEGIPATTTTDVAPSHSTSHVTTHRPTSPTHPTTAPPTDRPTNPMTTEGAPNPETTTPSPTEFPTETTPTPQPRGCPALDCADLEDGPHPNPEECESYCVCFQGQSFYRACPIPLHYNPALKACDWPEMAGCNLNPTTNAAPTQTQQTPTDIPTYEPTAWPTDLPTDAPTGLPTYRPTDPMTTTEGVSSTETTEGVSSTETTESVFSTETTEVVSSTETTKGVSSTETTEADPDPENPEPETTEAKPEPEITAGLPDPETTTTPAPKPTDCPTLDCTKLEDGSHPHPLECESYCDCVHGRSYYKACPYLLHFNPTTKICDWPQNAGCILDPQTTQTPIPGKCSKCPCFKFNCPGEGLYLDPYSCSSYFKCDGPYSIGDRFECEPGFFYCPKKGVCGLENACPCEESEPPCCPLCDCELNCVVLADSASEICKAEGNFRDPFQCNLYHSCSKSHYDQWIDCTRSCAEPYLIFCREKNTCDYECASEPCVECCSNNGNKDRVRL